MWSYMNGYLHLGHAFTMCKVDFTCRYKKLCGYNVLFPFGFHCTGMPICGAAKRLEKELELYTADQIQNLPETEENKKKKRKNLFKICVCATKKFTDT